MKTRILFGDVVSVDYYELDDKGVAITPDSTLYVGDGDGFYMVEGWTDEYHCEFSKMFETFSEAKEYADSLKETA